MADIDIEKLPRGEIELLNSAPSNRPQRPLTSAEKLEQTTVSVHSRDASGSSNGQQTQTHSPTATPASSTRPTNAFFSALRNTAARLRHVEESLDRKLGIESQAIVRKLPEERQPWTWHSALTMYALWASGTMNLSCMATGFLGWEFNLSLSQSILCCIFASLLGGAVTGFCATLGAATGLRQISISRYSFGWWPNKIVAVLNTIQQIGWSSVGCITGGIALNAVADGQVSVALGIVIIAVCSMIVSLVGLRAILKYEEFAWLVYLVVFLIVLGQTGRYADNSSPAGRYADDPELSPLTGTALAGTVLSLMAIVYGSSASWATVASDYYTQYPANVSRRMVFLLTTTGVALPTAFGMITGCVLSSGLNNRLDWRQTYLDEGIGFLIQEALYPRGFAKFILVLLVLSGINCNIINTYSAAISCQQFARPFALIPRFIWTILCFLVILALALAGRDQLLQYLENFLALLGYWCTSYFVIVFTEHRLFRKGSIERYDLTAWNTPSGLPYGFAALAAFLLGVGAWVSSMQQTWYVGPLATTFGPSGGDVANEFTLVVTLVAYVPLRYLELKRFEK